MKTWKIEFTFIVNAETEYEAIVRAAGMEEVDTTYIHSEIIDYDERFDDLDSHDNPLKKRLEGR